MAQEVTNFARFYALFNKLPCTGDREEFKKSIVQQYEKTIAFAHNIRRSFRQ